MRICNSIWRSFAVLIGIYGLIIISGAVYFDLFKQEAKLGFDPKNQSDPKYFSQEFEGKSTNFGWTWEFRADYMKRLFFNANGEVIRVDVPVHPDFEKIDAVFYHKWQPAWIKPSRGYSILRPSIIGALLIIFGLTPFLPSLEKFGPN